MLIGWFADIGLRDRLEVGGKGGSLGELQRAGIAVPPGFVVKTAAFERFMQSLERESPVRERVQSLNASRRKSPCCGSLNGSNSGCVSSQRSSRYGGLVISTTD